MRAAEALGLQVQKSSRNEDINDHVDYWLAYNSVSRWGVDVKGNTLPDAIWVELRNVHGKPGWLPGGATIVAVERPEDGR